MVDVGGRRDCRWTNGECFADDGDSGGCAMVADFFFAREMLGRTYVDVSIMNEEGEGKLPSAVAGCYGIRRGTPTHHSRSHGPRVLLP